MNARPAPQTTIPVWAPPNAKAKTHNVGKIPTHLDFLRSEDSVFGLAKSRVFLAALKCLFDLECESLWQVRFLHKPSQLV